ncbi:Hypp7542 [Branchiostoma lanceolatum]|uniref:Hypp7542 protein n=1 Tax=Branchiostoma lanceolatum TaxID=7740 RepID=A0A8K0EA82_BRALA|nr:Hypp7542 [Branchiostoma lanceolatum]
MKPVELILPAAPSAARRRRVRPVSRASSSGGDGFGSPVSLVMVSRDDGRGEKVRVARARDRVPASGGGCLAMEE